MPVTNRLSYGKAYSLGSLLGLLLDPDGGGRMFLRYVDELLSDCTASHLKRE
jgi:hypothetical protein